MPRDRASLNLQTDVRPAQFLDRFLSVANRKLSRNGLEEINGDLAEADFGDKVFRVRLENVTSGFPLSHQIPAPYPAQSFIESPDESALAEASVQGVCLRRDV